MRTRITQPMFLIAVIAAAGCFGNRTAPLNAPELTRRQAELLAREVLANTPERIHFEAGTTFEWVCLSPEVNENPPVLREEVMKLLEAKYKAVYLETGDIPKEFAPKKAREDGYRGGFIFSYTLTFEPKNVVKVDYGDYEAPLAASGHWKRYKWTGAKWKMVEKSPLICA